jgi:aminoglycoside 6'-N-acetyltransferase
MRMAEKPDVTSYRFVRLGHHHLPLIRRWFDQPHVRQWYGNPESVEDIADHINQHDIRSFLVLHNHLPIAYMQAYLIGGMHPYAADAKGGVGLDQFIGLPTHLSKGHGNAFIRSYLERCKAEGVERVYVDPKQDNFRAISAYEKAGFEIVGPRRCAEEGEVLLMEARLVAELNQEESKSVPFLVANKKLTENSRTGRALGGRNAKF